MKTYPHTSLVKKIIKRDQKGIIRSALNTLVKNRPVTGKALDLGANKNDKPSYYHYFNLSKLKESYFLDIESNQNPSVAGDAQYLPFKNGVFNTVICFNLVEHVPDPYKVINEVSRILKKGGKAYFFAPYLSYLHSDLYSKPGDYSGDYSRMSHQSWRFWCSKYFTGYKIFPVAFGPFAVGMVIFELFIPQFLRVPLSLLCLSIDSWIIKLRPYLEGKYLLGVYIEANK